MSTELAVRMNESMDVLTLGKVLAQSGYFQDARDASQAIVKVLAGQELGIGPIASMTGIHIVQGRVALGANLMAGQVKRSGRYDYRVVTMTDDKCEIAFLEGGQHIGTSAFTKEDAKRAGTKNMDKFPRNMLFARAMSNGVRWYCPDIFSAPVYTPEELHAGNDTNYVVLPTPEDIAPPAPVLVAPELDDATKERLATVKNLVVEIRRRGLTPLDVTPAAVKAASPEDYESLVAALRQTLETANELDDVPADLDAVAA